MKTKSRKIWSVSIALAVVLLFGGLLAASVMAQSRPSAPATLRAVVPEDGGVVVIYQG